MELPVVVFQLCVQGGLLTGSQANSIANGKGIKEESDWDIIVPFSKWEKVSPLIPYNVVLNKFNGIKFTDCEGNEIDIWAADIHQHLSNTPLGKKNYVIDIIKNRVFETKILNLGGQI